jgi:hypothetical protein
VLETEPRREKLNWRRVGRVQPTPARPVPQASLRWTSYSRKSMESYGYNSPDCPVRHLWWTRRSREKEQGDVAIIHQTVRWCTGLSGEPTAPAPTVVRAINARHVAALTVGWVHRTVRCAPDSVRCANRLWGATVDCARFGMKSRTGHATVAVRWRTWLSGVPHDRRQG